MYVKDEWSSPRAIERMMAMLGSHKKVMHFHGNGIQFVITRTDRAVLTAVAVDIYTIGMADVIEAQRRFPGIQHIVSSSGWDGYTAEAKEYGLQQHVGVFILPEFMGALWAKDPVTYVKRDTDGTPRYKYRSG